MGINLKNKVSKLQIPKIPRFPNFEIFKFPNSKFAESDVFKNYLLDLFCLLDLFLIFANNLVYSNPQIRDHTGPKKPDIMQMIVLRFSHNKIEKLVIGNEAE